MKLMGDAERCFALYCQVLYLVVRSLVDTEGSDESFTGHTGKRLHSNRNVHRSTWHGAVSHRNVRHCPRTRRRCRRAYLAVTHGWTVTGRSVLRSQVAAAGSENGAAGPRSATRRCTLRTCSRLLARVVTAVP